MSRRKSLAAKLSLGKLYRVPLREGAAEPRHSRASGRRESGARGGGDGCGGGSGAQQRRWVEREEREEEEEEGKEEAVIEIAIIFEAASLSNVKSNASYSALANLRAVCLLQAVACLHPLRESSVARSL